MFDPEDASVLADPYPYYARLRKEEPVLWLPDYDIWVISRHQEIIHVLRDTETFSSRLGLAAEPTRHGGPRTGVHFRIGAPGVRVLIALDPPEHAVFRRAAMEAFTTRRVAQLRDRVTSVVREQVRCLLERAEAGDADFARDVAEPVPALVLADLLGVPPDMRGELREWALAITADLGAAQGERAGLGRGLRMLRFFHQEVRRRRDGPGSDLLDLLANAHVHGLTDYEILSFCGFLVVAGVETTTNQLTNLMDVLLRRPDLQQQVRKSPELIPAAVQEALRYDTSVQALWRSTTRETTLAGRTLPAGARIFVMFASANRDEEQFDDPDSFRLDREPNHHVSFGHGIHFCLGARLARLEMETVLAELLASTTDISSHGESTRIESIALRGFSRQGIALTPTHTPSMEGPAR